MDDNKIGLIPAAGKGKRLNLPFPKELYPVIQDGCYKPVAQCVVENLTSAGVNHIVFIINSSKHQLIDYFGDGRRFNCRISYVAQESGGLESDSTSPGLAHALDAAFHLTRNMNAIPMSSPIHMTFRAAVNPANRGSFKSFLNSRSGRSIFSKALAII